MGLFDVLNGMQNGPRGARSGSGGTSPITMALLGLLAYKAVKKLSNDAGDGTARPSSGPGPSNGASSGLGDVFKRLGIGQGAGPGVGGLGAGGLGGMLAGGLGDLVRQFQGAGKGGVAGSWVSTGENKPIAPADLSKVLTQEQLDFLTARTGLTREELLAGLSEQLPQAVDQLTPAGRLPTPDEINRGV